MSIVTQTQPYLSILSQMLEIEIYSWFGWIDAKLSCRLGRARHSKARKK